MNNQNPEKLAPSIESIAELLGAISEVSGDRSSQRELEAELTHVRKSVRQKWMCENQLIERPSGFSLSSMKTGQGARWNEDTPASHAYLDHSEFYSTSRGKGKVILAHLYGEDAPSRARAFAEDNGLELSMPLAQKASWWYPGETTLVCYATPGLKIRWLEEQANVLT